MADGIRVEFETGPLPGWTECVWKFTNVSLYD